MSSTQRFNLLDRINHHLCSFVTLINAKMPFWFVWWVMTSTVDFRCQRNTSFRLTWGIIVPRSWQPLWRKISAHSLLPALFACHRAERPLPSRIRTSAKYWKRRNSVNITKGFRLLKSREFFRPQGGKSTLYALRYVWALQKSAFKPHPIIQNKK